MPPQNGYIARRCPVRAQNDVLRPSEPLAPAPELVRRIERGRDFEEDAVAVVKAGATAIDALVGDTPEELERSTVEAMASGAAVILGGRLPTDWVGSRVGKPDLLVAAEGGGYRAVEVKHHLTLEPVGSGDRVSPALCSPQDRPFLEVANSDEWYTVRRREDDLLQLAHYQRMLEAAGLAARDGRWAGIIGTEGRVVWHDLDAPIWRTPSSTGTMKLRTTMERYDFEFDFRLDVVAAARNHLSDPSVDLLVVPVRVSECDTCPWWGHCREQLEADPGDVSLLPRVGWREWKIHRDHGIRNRKDLAALDPRTAALVASGVNVAEMQALIQDLPPEMPIESLKVVVRSKKQLSRLEESGVTTFGDLASLDATTAKYSDSGLSALPTQIDLARAALGPDPIYRRRGQSSVAVPRADIEVDIDMENIEEGVYLWGALLTTRADGKASSSYHSFVTWTTLTPAVELENSLRFWTWFREIMAEADRNGNTCRAYCYNAAAENTYLRRLGLAGGLLEEVSDFIRSDQWVDLLQVVDEQLITGGGSGLKKIAPIAGYSWSVEDPGGGISMLYYDLATGGESETERIDAQNWLLTYNQGDVEATLAVRNWIESAGNKIPPIEVLDPSFAAPVSAESGFRAADS